MKIAVICANGRAGSLIVKEALEKNLDVTAIVRGENKSLATKLLQKDLFDLTKEDLTAFDAVVCAFGAWDTDKLSLYPDVAKHLCSILKGTNTRILFVGGAGSLYMNKEHTMMLLETPDFPEEYKGVANAGLAYLNEIRKYNDVNWTFVSPAAAFLADGEKTGQYILGGEEFMVNADGKSMISYADYAKAMIDEIVSGNHIKQRISVIWK